MLLMGGWIITGNQPIKWRVCSLAEPKHLLAVAGLAIIRLVVRRVRGGVTIWNFLNCYLGLAVQGFTPPQGFFALPSPPKDGQAFLGIA